MRGRSSFAVADRFLDDARLASSLGIRGRLASSHSTPGLLLASMASLRAWTSGSFGQFAAVGVFPEAGGGRSILEGITSGERSRYLLFLLLLSLFLLSWLCCWLLFFLCLL